MNNIDLFVKSLLGVCMLAQFSACEHVSSGGNQRPKSTTSIDKMEASDDDLDKLQTATYMAVLNPLNIQLGSEASGSFTFHKDQDFIVTDVRIIGSVPNIIHGQNVYIGESCPTELNDLNKDGIIDIMEAHSAAGDIVIPLDGDINTQYSLLGMYPLADAWGAYVYSLTASFEKFIYDLQDDDEVTTDEIIKVSPLRLTGRVVMVHGIADDLLLPDSVATNGGLSANQTIPIACGVIQKVETVPGTFEPDDITIGTINNGEPSPGRRPRTGTGNVTGNGNGNGNRNGTGNSNTNSGYGSNTGRTSPLGPRRGSNNQNQNQGQCPEDSGREC